MHDSTPYAFPISLQAQLESLRSPGANRSKTVRQGTADVGKSRRLVSVRSRTCNTGGRQSDDTIAVLPLPVQPRRSESHLARHFGMDSPLSAQQLGIHTKNRRLGANVVCHGGAKKHFRRPRHTHESIGQQTSRQRLGRRDFETISFAICIAIGWRQPSGSRIQP